MEKPISFNDEVQRAINALIDVNASLRCLVSLDCDLGSSSTLSRLCSECRDLLKERDL